ncbi:Gfo/Idh/MocA family oxidoreductase [Sphingomonas sp.]|uniref:Gfo/Idh/MocA family protein n=1 Tax=Sphingomonas sp. TaxID=28214 RepID=UPI002D80DC0D|nr:Gfo/Idh/MocA family oxidoreductase [Sphingomonas sp.]HEU0045902.1 Gfo/Idh/MocA family oxidoreductase [Sphingomonas sp.]
MSEPIRIALVGIGKIARDQHIPALAANPAYDLVACVTRHAPLPGVPAYPSIEALLAERHDVQAVSFCTPPQGRHAIARQALDAGKHVMLEKPPGASVTEIDDLIATATAQGVALYATWHTREAPAIEPARSWLADRRIERVTISWKEDVRRWHPGQAWIWEPGGLGVFDPGINALSAITAIHPHRIFLTAAALDYPANRGAPITARLSLADALATPIEATFDWLQTGDQIWEIAIEAEGSTVLLSGGGAKLAVDGTTLVDATDAEYPGLYRRFAELVATRSLDVDLAPFRLVADAFMLGSRRQVAAFED